MTLEFDHLFICTEINAPEARALLDFGLTEGTSNRHPGQGTANRRFFFRNAMLELLWVCDSAEVRSPMIAPTHLWERWQNRNCGACPFGFCFRSSGEIKPNLPFSTWDYKPPYLPPSLAIPVGTNADIATEPMLFYLPFGQRPDRNPQRQPLNHSTKFKEISRVTLITPHTETLSAELQGVIQTNLIQIRGGDRYGLEIGFDGEKQGEKHDFHPKLPLRFCW
jgi:hypothetical protein